MVRLPHHDPLHTHAGGTAMRSSRALSLVLGLALALLVFAPSTASALNRFEATEYAASVSGEQTETQTLTLEGEFAVKCKKASLSGELIGPSETLVLTPTYSECTEGGLSATVETHGCQYVVKATTNTSENNFSGTQDISCPTEQNIVVTGLEKQCEAKISGQSSLSSVTYNSELEASPPTIRMEENLSGMKYTVSKDEGSCPFSGTGEHTGATLKGPAKLMASIGVETIGIAVAATTTTRLCAEQPVKLQCPKTFYGANTTVKGSGPPTGFPNPKLLLLEKGATKNTVECTGTTMSFKTKEAANNPLPIESYEYTFAGCQTKPNNAKCTVTMKNAGTTTGELSFARVMGNKGWGYVTASMTLKVECGKEVEECEYSRTDFSVWFVGAKVPAVSTIDSLQLKKVAGKGGCFQSLDWDADYEVTQPTPAWVST